MENVARVRNITDLAHLAGVSPGTVSRALADSHLIAQKTRDRIQAIAREHDFRPNALARNLRTRRTGAIAVVIPLAQHGKPQPRDSECLSLLAPISAALCARDYDLLLLTADGIDPRWLIRLADSGRCDGILLLGYAELHGALDDDAIQHPVVTMSDLQVENGAQSDGEYLVNLLLRQITNSLPHMQQHVSHQAQSNA
jgi:DNA-binding LacI/PurR family transcriptional regulator